MKEKKAVATIEDVTDEVITAMHEGSLETGFKLTSLKFFCVICTKHYEIFKKDKNGDMDKQQICQHMTFHGAKFAS